MDSFRIGFVSGKLGDVDGVSLEVEKWINVLQDMGHEVVTIAGKYRAPLTLIPEEHQVVFPEIRFDSPSQRHYERIFFPYLNKVPVYLTEEKLKGYVEECIREGLEVGEHLFEKVKDFDLDVLIAENTNAMPMTLLGGVAVHHVATEKRVATIFHHHDFWWERSRFSNNRIETFLNRIMPPSDIGLEHVVISSYAAHILTSIKRVSPHVVPNCEDFDHPVVLDDYNSDFRQELGFSERDVLVVQPTRIVRRKRIEDSIRLIAALLRAYPDLRGRVHYIISLYQGDEPDVDYVDQIKALAEREGIPLHLIAERVSAVRGRDAEGRKLYTNRDVLVNADLVTYLPLWEGFGNALLEAVAARVPVVTTTYLVYKTDIKLPGMRLIEVRDRYDEDGRLIIPDQTLEEIHHVLTHPEERKVRVEETFQVARAEFGLHTLRKRLERVFELYGDEIRASRKRLRKAKRLYSV
ncbi:glycosyl transferase group 1 [Spirochaeta thermophila DSM 6578]|uniref:Glycosyl transferase group 1 n=1 Tax=Winmispira thermophila (strain ATCC 700085 / DSM 6578 / Z-1203) TaxID=869211 RepID=G0GBG2_WINT7|nr:glycosyltransferase family 4 protein [Spirochaeta thermophila]AEJ60321.1 glycosyl transferase group 1 [Spirochaeta thermophila DSM 6578]